VGGKNNDGGVWFSDMGRRERREREYSGEG